MIISVHVILHWIIFHSLFSVIPIQCLFLRSLHVEAKR